MFAFENTYAKLPRKFASRVNPTPVAAPKLIRVNVELAKFLKLDADALASAEGVEVLAGNRVAEGSEPLAMAYAGHQFGYFVPQLGDGRANLLGELIAVDGKRYDVQLKGAGPTVFSRNGDGRAALGPVLREYVVSEAMAALGVPTTRALAAVTTGETVYREEALPGAVLTRVAASHLRVGTFQYFAAQEDVEDVRELTQYAMQRHYPETLEAEYKYKAFLMGVVRRQAQLVAHWMMLGFVHGVMNTDNTSISGETIDYGPCAFLEAYNPDTVFSSIDRNGRYSYSNQVHAMHWNLARLAECLLPLLVEEAGNEEAGLAAAHEALDGFAVEFDRARLDGLRRKIGLLTLREGDLELAEDLLERMAAGHVDFTLMFRKLCDGAEEARQLFAAPAMLDEWAARWHARLAEENSSDEDRLAVMQAANPAFIPRNHLVQEMIEAAVAREDFGPFATLLEVVSLPYADRPEFARYAKPARPEQRVRQTFCGT